MMILQKKCPRCKNTTLMWDDMDEAYCIVCGRSVTSDDAVPVTETERDGKTFTVIFRYERGFLSEFDRGCRITVDSKMEGVASVDSDMRFQLSPGAHHVSAGAHVTAGVNSTDVLTSANLDIDCDQTYVIKSSGGTRRKMEITRLI